MSTFLIRSATSQSSSYPIVLTKLGGPRSRPNTHLKFVEVPRIEPATSWSSWPLDQRGGRLLMITKQNTWLLIEIIPQELIHIEHTFESVKQFSYLGRLTIVQMDNKTNEIKLPINVANRSYFSSHRIWNVNVSLNKTLIRSILAHSCESSVKIMNTPSNALKGKSWEECTRTVRYAKTA